MRGDEAAKARARDAARGAPGSPIDPGMAVQINRILEPTLKHFERVAEKTETLNGDRQGAKERRAVRQSDLSSLSDIGLQRSKKVPDTNAPTKAQIDDIIDDIRDIHNALRAIVTTLNGL